MPTVSHSEVDSFLLCRRKHYYGYTLSLKKQSTGPALTKGSAGHKVLEAFYRAILEIGGNDVAAQRAAFDEALEEAELAYDEIEQAGETGDDDKHLDLYNILFEWYFPNEPYVRNGWRILAVEKEFNLLYDTKTDSKYPFVVDLIVRDPDGKIVVIDHKFQFDFITYNDAALLPQIPKYIGGLRALNHTVDYGQYNQLRTRKQKAMTADKQLKQHDVKPNATRVKTTFLEQIRAASEIQSLKELTLEEQSDKALRVANKMVCNSCSFRDLCITELEGGNTQLMIQTEFEVRERKAFVDVSEDA